MSETQSDSGIFAVLKDLTGLFSSAVANELVTSFNEGISGMYSTVEHNALELEQTLINRLTITFVQWASYLFIILSAVFFMIDYLQLPRALSFVSIGALLLAIALVANSRTRRY